MKIIEASLLAVSNKYFEFHKTIKSLIKNKINHIHYDVMDNIFVPNVAFNGEHLKFLKRKGFKISIHLMVANPKIYVENYINKYKFDYLTFHCETISIENSIKLIKYIKEHNIKAGIAIKPNTDIRLYESVIKECDIITIMGVEPGFGGQKYIESTTDKIKKIKKMANKNTILQIDGGVNLDVIKLLKNDIDMFVSGSFLINNINKIEEIMNALN